METKKYFSFSSFFSKSSSLSKSDIFNNESIFLGVSLKTIATVIFILCLFPYLSLIITPFDTQPWALIASLVFIVCLLSKNKFFPLPSPLLAMLITVCYSGLVYLTFLIFGKSNFLLGLRAFVDYLSLFSLAYVGYTTFTLVRLKPYFVAIGIWFIAGIFQLMFGTNIVAGLVSRVASGGGRGLTSLAPEPAFYATLCVSFIVLNELFYKSNRYGHKTYLVVLLALVSQVVLSYSGVGIMLIVLLGLSKFIQLAFIRENQTEKIIALVALLVTIFSVGIFLKPKPLSFTSGLSAPQITSESIVSTTVASSPLKAGLLSDTRGGYLLRESLSNPKALFLREFSISSRLGNPILGLYGGLVQTHGLGFGLAAHNDTPIPSWMSTVLGQNRNFGGRIEGGLVSAVYELGLVGLLFLIVIFATIFASIKINKKLRPALLSSLMILFIPMFIFGPVASPLLGYIWGIHLYYVYNY